MSKHDAASSRMLLRGEKRGGRHAPSRSRDTDGPGLGPVLRQGTHRSRVADDARDQGLGSESAIWTRGVPAKSRMPSLRQNCTRLAGGLPSGHDLTRHCCCPRKRCGPTRYARGCATKVRQQNAKVVMEPRVLGCALTELGRQVDMEFLGTNSVMFLTRLLAGE